MPNEELATNSKNIITVASASNMRNYERAVPPDWKDLRNSIGGCNNEPVVMREVITECEESKLRGFFS